MAKIYTKNTWQDEVLAGSERYNILEDNGSAFKSTMQIALSTSVVQAGTTADATKMNNIENGIDGIDTLVDIHGATGKTTPDDADETTIVDSAASFARKKLTWANIKAALKTYLDTLYVPVANLNGWTVDSATWTYASATSFTISGDVRSKFGIGTKIKLTQTTAKYFSVVSTSYAGGNTTVNITGGSDYSLVNAAITSPSYAYGNPPDFPDWFTYAVTATGFTGTPTITYHRFKISGKTCFIHVDGIDGTSNATTFTFNLPVAAAFSYQIATVGYAIDNNTIYATPQAYVSVNGLTATAYLSYFQTAWTNANRKAILFPIWSYPIG